MPQEYIQISNFGFGLDTRRSILTSQPGTLVSLTDGHVNQGGEIEKRKAFGVLGGAALPAGCFGLEISSTLITTFGSIATPGVFATTFSGLVLYQRLQSPLGTAMSKVIGSTSFEGNCWVIAQFNSGAETYGFYNGVLVFDFTDGLITSGLNTNVKIAAALAALVNRQTSTTGYSAVQNPNPNDNSVNITGRVGGAYKISQSVVTAAGVITTSLVTTGVPAVGAVQATGQFQITGGNANAGTNKITSVKVGTTELLSASVDWVTSNELTAAAVVTNINGFTGTSTYAALAQGSTIIIYAPAGTGSNNKVVKVTSAGNICIGDCSFSFTGQTTMSITSCVANGVDLTGGGVAAQATLQALAAALVTAINTNTGTTGYLAFNPKDAGGNAQNFVRVSKAVTSSDDSPVNIQVSIATGGTGGGVQTGSSAPLIAGVNEVVVVGSTGNIGTIGLPIGQVQTDPGDITAFATGGSLFGYTFLWSAVTGANPYSISILSKTASSPIFYVALPAQIIGNQFGFTTKSVQGQFICTVTDSAGNVSVTPVVSITLIKI